jgi:biopolymer transport protein ExbD
MRLMMGNRSDKQVFLRGDGGIELQELLDIMDRLKAAGVEKVGIVSKLPGEQ